VQRLLRALRKNAAQKFIVEAAVEGYQKFPPSHGAVDGSGYGGPDPPTAPIPVPALNADPQSMSCGQPLGNSDEAIRGSMLDADSHSLADVSESLPRSCVL
jgi:hypothetical protein